MSVVPDQMRQYGGVPVGAHRLAEIFNSGNIWFVDGDNGNAGNTGKQPDWAYAKPSEAVSSATREGVIYIRPRTSTTSSDVYYADNITCPATKPHLQFIGCGAGTIPGYRGSAQIQASTTTSPLFTIQGSGVVLENLHLNGSSHTAATNQVQCNRSSTYPGAVCLQVRNCRILAGTTYISTAIQMGSCQYSIIEDNLFLDCYRSVHMEAVYGSPQSYTVRRNIFSGKVANRDYDIMITITDVNSRGHIIANNIFADGLPAHTDARANRFIMSSAPTTASSTGIVCGNYFADANADSMGTGGAICKLPAGWFAVGNFYEGTSATGKSGFVTRA